MVGLVFAAMIEYHDGDYDLLTIQDSRIGILNYLIDYYGINSEYVDENPPENLGYTKIHYSEFEDDLEGYYKFKAYNQSTKEYETDKIYVYCKQLNEICR